MKKLISLFLSIIIAFSLTACDNSSANTDTVGGISEEHSAILEEAGISREEFAAMPEEQRQALLDELGIEAENQQQNDEEPKPAKATLDDVAAGGSYVVTIGDSMMWNKFTLYYEDGVLVKIEVSFQKNDEEEAAVEIIEGDAIAEYGLFFIDYTSGVQELTDALKQQGYTNMYIERNN